MIIACPTCETRFRVAHNALGSIDRRLRCANCGNVWLFSLPTIVAEATAATPAKPSLADVASPASEAETASSPGEAGTVEFAPDKSLLVEPALPAEAIRAEQRIDPPPQAEERIEPPVVDSPHVLPPPWAAVGVSRLQRRYWPIVGGVGVAALVAAFVLIAVIARDRIMATWPATTSAYAALNLAPPLGAGLKVTVTPSRTADSLVIAGDIVNAAAVARPIPKLRLTLRDNNKSDLTSKVIDPPVGRLPPGATVHFNTVFDHPNVAASKVDVTFATD